MKYLISILLFTIHHNISSQAISSNDSNQMDSLLKVSNDLLDKKEFEKAREPCLAAEKMAAEKWGKETVVYGTACNNLGKLYTNLKKFKESETWLLESKAIRENLLGKNEPDYAITLYNLANLYRDAAQYLKAESIFLECIDIQKKITSTENPQYANSLNGLGILYSLTGQYDKAEPLFLECKRIWEHTLGKDSPSYSMSLNNLGQLYNYLGLFEKSEKFLLEALELKSKLSGAQSPDYASSLSNLANLYKKMKQYDKAEKRQLQALEIRKNSLSIDHPDYAASLNNLASVYRDWGRFEQAEPLYLECKSVYEKTIGKESPEYAMCTHNLALLYNYINQYSKAEMLFEESRDIRERILGINHPDYKLSMHYLADHYERTKRYGESDKLREQSMIQERSRILKSSTYLSEAELFQYISLFENNNNLNNSFMLQRQKLNSSIQSGLLPALIYDNTLFHKGFLLYAANQLRSLIKDNPAVADIQTRIKELQKKLTIEYSKPLNKRKGVEELEEKNNDAEKEMARSVAGYSEALRQVKWQEVQSSLKQNEAAIEFISFAVNFPKTVDSVIYAALIVKSGSTSPLFITLFEEKSLDSLLRFNTTRRADYVNSLYFQAGRGAVSLNAPKRGLFELLWKPLEENLKDIKKIFYSPSGLLHRINLNAIPLNETENLADHYQLIQLNSTRQLVITDKNQNSSNDAVLFGGIKYDLDSSLQTKEPSIMSKSKISENKNTVESNTGSESWNYLPGTEREVNSIESILHAAGIQSTLKKAYDATEESFKTVGINKTSSPRIIHLATHGYFFSDIKETGTANSAEKTKNESVFKTSAHPMLRSGLIMAGGNASWQGEKQTDKKEDGILTAYEISQMDLSGTELVVLSACETGLGDIQGNEGVYGLQRAFKIAGAKYIIMSLWQVPDKQTSMLMITFYKKWLENKMSIPDAFHAAQKELRDLGFDPYQWAGFVLIE